MPRVPTKITVRVIARTGKFLGDDIGGAEVTIRDVRSGELLAQGQTHGGSGPLTVMTVAIMRNQPIPISDPSNDSCRFEAVLMSGVRSQEAGVRIQNSGVRSQNEVRAAEGAAEGLRRRCEVPAVDTGYS